MKLCALLVVALLGFCALARADGDVDESDVVVLTTANFDETLAANEFVLVEFYAPWCGHCKRLVPEYAAAATQLKGSGIVLGKVDATIEKDLASKFGVRGYPTLKWFRSGSPTDYTGDRTADGLVKWTQKKSGPVTVTITSQAELDAFVAGKEAVVGFFASKDAPEYATFQGLAKDDTKFGDFAFGECTDASLVAAQGGAGFKLFRTFGDALSFDGSLPLGDWVLSFGYPLVSEVDGKSFSRYVASGLPLSIVFLDADEDNSATMSTINAVAEAMRGKLNIGHADGVRYIQQIKRMGGDGETLPWIGIISNDQKLNYPYAGAFETSALLAWAQGVVAGSVEPHVRSEPIPESNNGPVTVVVQKTLKEIVYDEKKDVLLEIYAPWCGHCKQLAPIYDQLGAAFADVDSVVIAKIDGSANDVPNIEYQGFPTLKFFPAGANKTPVDYNGERTFDALKAFVEKSAVVPINRPAGTAAAEGKEEL